jgi:hypothetical protein
MGADSGMVPGHNPQNSSMMNNVKLGISGVSPDALVSKGRVLISKMTGNPTFPSPTPTLAELQTAVNELQDAISAAAFGDRQKISERNTKYDALYLLITRLGGYVSSVAAGNADAVLSSGFDVRRRNTPAQPVAPPIDVRASRTSVQGRVEVQWAPDRGARSYVVEMTTTDPAEGNTVWAPCGFTTRTKLYVDGLAIGKFYWFRVKAVGTRENSGFSDVALVMAA